MARKYINPNRPSPSLVTDALLAEARVRADAAAARVLAAERADPSSPGWDDEFAAATAQAAAARRRVDALAALRAAQLERSGQRDTAVNAAGLDAMAAGLAASRDQLGAAAAARRRVDALAALRAAQLERSGQRDTAVNAAGLDAMAAGLAASRDQLGAAAADHLRALAALAAASDAHNTLLATGRARLAELGLAVRDDLVDVDAGGEHGEGTIDGGVRAGGRDWTPVPAPGLAVHALLAVFGVFRGPFAGLRFAYPAHLVASRPDGLAVPSLADAGVTLPAVVVPDPPPRVSVADVWPAGTADGGDGNGHRPGVRTVA
jgi:hypothetical protein